MSDPNNLHLECPWVMYVHTFSISSNYGTSYSKVGAFQTVAKFWELFNNMPAIHHLHSDIYLDGKRVIAYSLFKNNIRPEWEYNTNAHGSDWGCRQILSVSEMHDIWFALVLAAVGERIRNCIGVRVINKTNRNRELHKIEIWLDTCNQKAVKDTYDDIEISLSESGLEMPNFAFMNHEEKQCQAYEYKKKRNEYCKRKYAE